jgi:hypothetical protein
VQDAVAKVEATGLPPASAYGGSAWIAVKDESAIVYAATRQRIDHGFSARSAGELARRIRTLAGDES